MSEVYQTFINIRPRILPVPAGVQVSPRTHASTPRDLSQSRLLAGYGGETAVKHMNDIGPYSIFRNGTVLLLIGLVFWLGALVLSAPPLAVLAGAILIAVGALMVMFGALLGRQDAQTSQP